MATRDKYSSTQRKFTPFSAGLQDYNLGLVKNAALMRFKDDNLKEQSYFSARPSLNTCDYLLDSGASIGRFISGSGDFIATKLGWYKYSTGVPLTKLTTGSVQTDWTTHITGVPINKSSIPTIIFDNTVSVNTTYLVVSSVPVGSNTVYFHHTPTTSITAAATVPFKANPFGVSMDGYLFLAEQDSDTIYNSDLNDFATWDVGVNLINASQFPGNIVALNRLNSYIVVFKDSSIEFFYNAGLSETSPLERNSSYTKRVGLVSAGSMCTTGSSIIFIGKDLHGARKVFELTETKLDVVSTPAVEELLAAYSTDRFSLDVNSFFMSIGGKKYYILQDVATEKTLAYDLSEQIWAEWNTANQTVFPALYCKDTVLSTASPLFSSGCTLIGRAVNDIAETCVYYGQFNTEFHYLVDQLRSDYVSTNNYRPFRIELVLPPTDFGESNRKFVRELSISGYFPEDIRKSITLQKLYGGVSPNVNYVRYTDSRHNLNFKNWGSANVIKVSASFEATTAADEVGASAQALRIYGINYEISTGVS